MQVMLEKRGLHGHSTPWGRAVNWERSGPARETGRSARAVSNHRCVSKWKGESTELRDWGH